MTDLLITMSASGVFSLSPNAGRIEEYCAKRLKIKLNTDFLSSAISYYTLSFEPYSLSRKIITENIYRNSSNTEGIIYADGYIFCPIYDYIAVSPIVSVQIDAYETDSSGNVTAIIKSGIFNLEFANSLTGEGMMLETVRPDVKFVENVRNAVDEALETTAIDGEKIKAYSISGRRIAINAISTPHLQNYAVTSIKIKNGAVTTYTIADGNVTEEKLADSSVTEPKIADGAVTTDKIGDKTVTSAKLADQSVSNVKLSNLCVSETKLRPLSVATSKIQDKAVTPAKLDRTYLTQHQSLNGYATEEWVKEQNFLTEEKDLAGYATEDWVKEQNYLTEHVNLDGYATKDWVEDQNYLTEYKNLDGYATEEWVKEQNYLTEHVNLDGYATEDWVKNQNYLTEHISLDGYATEEWVMEQGLISDEDLPAKLSDLENDMAVSFLSQNLTEEQKKTAIENIGAVRHEEGKMLSQNDFTDEDKAKLDAALTEHQDISMKADISSLSAVSFSGSYNDLSDLPEACGFTDELKTNYDKSYEHCLSEHAPVEAEENIIESITLNGKTVQVDNKNVSVSVIDFDEKETVFVEVY